MVTAPRRADKDAIMITRKSISIAAAAICLTLAAQASFASAANHLVTRAQLNQIPDGCTAAQIKQALGAPESVTRWMDGSRSLVYEMTTHNNQQQHVYVDLGSNDRMTDIQIIER